MQEIQWDEFSVRGKISNGIGGYMIRSDLFRYCDVALRNGCDELKFKVVKDIDSLGDKARLSGKNVEKLTGDVTVVLDDSKAVINTNERIAIYEGNCKRCKKINIDMTNTSLVKARALFYLCTIGKVEGIGDAINNMVRASNNEDYDMANMFYECKCDIAEIDDININESVAVDTKQMFYRAKINELRIVNCNIHNFKNVRDMFFGCHIQKVVIKNCSLEIKQADSILNHCDIGKLDIVNSDIYVGTCSDGYGEVEDISICNSKFNIETGTITYGIKVGCLRVFNCDLCGCEDNLLKCFKYINVATDNDDLHRIVRGINK